MNRVWLWGMAVCFSGFAVTASAQDFERWAKVADQIGGNANQARVTELVKTVQTLSAHCGDHNNPTPPNPTPRGDGRVPLPPSTSTPPVASPGYVWVGDHWERAKAPAQPPVANPRPTNPTTGGATGRDHRTNPPVVRDHRNDGPVVRDHRTQSSVVRDHRGGR